MGTGPPKNRLENTGPATQEPWWRRRALLMAVAIATLGAGALSAAAAATDFLPGDRAISAWAQGLPQGNLEPAMTALSRMGSTPMMLGLLLLSAAILMVRSQPSHCTAVLMAASTGALIPVMKGLVERPRPDESLVAVLVFEESLSFPSGHAFMAAAYLGAVIYHAPRVFGPSRVAVLAVRTGLAGTALGIGFSRIYLGAHWASDVLGGYLLGALSFAAVTWLYERAVRPRLESRERSSAGEIDRSV